MNSQTSWVQPKVGCTVGNMVVNHLMFCFCYALRMITVVIETFVRCQLHLMFADDMCVQLQY